MPLNATQLKELVLRHLLEVAEGRCSISDETLQRHDEPAVLEILAGIQILHEDLQYQTERGELAAQLASRNAQIETIIANAPVALALCDAHFNVQWANEQAASMLQETNEELLRGRWPQLAAALHGGTPDLSPVLLGDDVDFGNLRSETPDGSRYFDVYYRAVKEHEAVSAVLVIGHEITAHREREAALRRLNESLQRANDDLEQFAFIASHDLRAPLRAVLTCAEWLEEDLGDAMNDETRRVLELLVARTTRMGTLLEDLLAYARAGRSQVVVSDVDVNQLLDEIVDDLSPLADLHMDIGKMPSLRTAATPLRHVFNNLILNARTHHDREACHVSVRATEIEGAWRFEVTDDGPGIPTNLQAKALTMFKTLQPRDRREGTGIGLALVKKLVEDCGGEVVLNSPVRDGRGLSVVFTWPERFEALSRDSVLPPE